MQITVIHFRIECGYGGAKGGDNILAIKDLKPRAVRILAGLLEQSHPLTTGELAARFKVTPRSIRYDLDEIEQACVPLGLRLVRRRNGVWLEGDNQQKSNLAQLVFSDQVPVSEPSASEQRLYRLLAVLLFQDEPVLVKQLEDVLEASPRTVYTDMDRAEAWLANVGLQLIRKRHYGARIEGPELLRRHAALRLIRESVQVGTHKPGPLRIQQIEEFLLTRLADTEIISALERCLCEVDAVSLSPKANSEEFILFLAIQIARMRAGATVSFTRTQLKQIMDTAEHASAWTIADALERVFQLSFTDEEAACITLYLLGIYSQTQLNEETFYTHQTNPMIEDIVTQMLASVDSALGTSLLEDKDLVKGLILHVKPMVYRLLYGIPVQNYLIDDIRTHHTLAYQAAVIACRCLESLSGRSVSAAETGFIALHIGAALERRRTRHRPDEKDVRVLVVCAGGIGTGKILQSQIEAIHENLHVIGTVDVHHVQEADSLGADVIISTLPLDNAPLPHIVVHPLLSETDKHRIAEWLAGFTRLTAVVPTAASLKASIRQLIEQRFRISRPDAVDREIDKLLRHIGPYLLATLNGGHGTEPDNQLTGRKKAYRMIDLLTTDSIGVKCRARNRDEVVEISGRLLVETGAVEPRYVDAMKKSIAVNGPYMVIVPGVALLHARPEDGVKQVCMSLVTLEEGIVFGHPDNDPVDIAIAFGAVDQHQHLESLADLMRLLADEKSMKALREATTVDQVLQTLANVAQPRGPVNNT